MATYDLSAFIDVSASISASATQKVNATAHVAVIGSCSGRLQMIAKLYSVLRNRLQVTGPFELVPSVFHATAVLEAYPTINGSANRVVPAQAELGARPICVAVAVAAGPRIYSQFATIQDSVSLNALVAKKVDLTASIDVQITPSLNVGGTSFAIGVKT